MERFCIRLWESFHGLVLIGSDLVYTSYSETGLSSANEVQKMNIVVSNRLFPLCGHRISEQKVQLLIFAAWAAFSHMHFDHKKHLCVTPDTRHCFYLLRARYRSLLKNWNYWSFSVLSNYPATRETSGVNSRLRAVSFSLANGMVLDRLDHLPEVVPFRLERFGLEPFHARLHYSKNCSGTVSEPFHRVV